MKKHFVILLLLIVAEKICTGELTPVQESSLDDDAQRKIYNSLLIRERLQVGSFIVSSDGTVNELDVTGNVSIDGSLDVHGAITINGSPISSGSGSSGGTGNVVGPASATTPTAVVLFTDATGKAIEQSANNPVNIAPVTIDSSTNLANVNNVTVTANINLPATATDYSQGVITLGGANFIHAVGGAGAHNTAIGANALIGVGNSGAGDNVAVGTNALESLQSGNFNVAVGENALNANVSGANNVAVGQAALFVNTSSDNVGIGAFVLDSTISGTQNVAIGSNALTNLGNGNANIALGYNAGMNANGTSSGNIYIGNVGAAENDTIRIGTSGTQTTCFIAGINGATVGASNPVLVNASGQLGTSVSSGRYKKDITTMESVTAALMKLRPVRFRYKINDETTPREYGLIAEEVEAVLSDLVIYKDGQPETVKYHLLPTLLLKAVQELATENNAQQEVIAQLMQRIAALEARTT